MKPNISIDQAKACSSPAPFPWHEVMSFGFGVLRLSSDEFWSLTPREFAAAMAALDGPATSSIDRSQLQRLMAQFPDTPKIT